MPALSRSTTRPAFGRVLMLLVGLFIAVLCLNLVRPRVPIANISYPAVRANNEQHNRVDAQGEVGSDKGHSLFNPAGDVWPVLRQDAQRQLGTPAVQFVCVRVDVSPTGRPWRVAVPAACGSIASSPDGKKRWIGGGAVAKASSSSVGTGFLHFLAPPPGSSPSHRPLKLDAVVKHGYGLRKLATRTLVPHGSSNAAEIASVRQAFARNGTSSDLVAQHGGVAAHLDDMVHSGMDEASAAVLCVEPTALVVNVHLGEQRRSDPLPAADQFLHNGADLRWWKRLSSCASVVYTVAAPSPSKAFSTVIKLATQRFEGLAFRQCELKELDGLSGVSRGDRCARPAEEAAASIEKQVPQQGLPLCRQLAVGTWSMQSVIKLGTKTGIYKATKGTNTQDFPAVILKQFNLLQYATFRGYLALVNGIAAAAPTTSSSKAKKLRSASVNLPTKTCFSPEVEDSVFQEQPMLPGRNLKLFVNEQLREFKNRVSTSDWTSKRHQFLSWKVRVEIATQIVCAMQFLHDHPAGPFTFDDNHPEQYIVHRDAQTGTTRVTLIDIDTVQKTAPHLYDATASPGTKCRCFYCRGRSNCMFLNTPEGYDACGQSDGLNGDLENTGAVVKGLQCTLKTDAWYVAQLLLYLATGAAPWEGVDLATVVRRLKKGSVPSISTDEPRYDMLVSRLFKQRLPMEDALQELVVLCNKHDCGVRECPA